MLPQFQPLDVPTLADEWRDARRVDRWVWGFVLLGVAIRLVGYLLRFPLWVDECMLAENLLDRDFVGLLSPLANRQVAPPGFLWLEQVSIRLFGFSEFSLRLFPLLCGIGSLFLFRHLASRLLSGLPLVLAVACLAVAKTPQGLSANMKPYASDLLVATALLILIVEWLRRPDQTRWLWLLAAAAPLALFLSYPAIFVAAGTGICLAIPVWRRRHLRTWIAYFTYTAALLAAFAGMLRLTAGPAADSTRAFMVDYWTIRGGFPPAELLGFLSWLFQVHLGDKIFAIPFAAENGGGIVVFVCCMVGGLKFCRHLGRAVLGVFVCPFVLLFLAAVARRYPCGGHIRLVQFLAPGVAILCGLGAAVLLTKVARAETRRRLSGAVLLGLAAFGVGLSARDLWRPYHVVDDACHRDFARRFWADEPEAVTVCALSDLGQKFYSDGWYAYYRCYQKIYSRRHHAEEKFCMEQLEQLGRPLKLVIYYPPHQDPAPGPVTKFLSQFEPAFEPSGRDRLWPHQNLTDFDVYGSYEVLHLVPRRAASPPAPATARR